jgi:hypothetical protein
VCRPQRRDALGDAARSEDLQELRRQLRAGVQPPAVTGAGGLRIDLAVVQIVGEPQQRVGAEQLEVRRRDRVRHRGRQRRQAYQVVVGGVESIGRRVPNGAHEVARQARLRPERRKGACLVQPHQRSRAANGLPADDQRARLTQLLHTVLDLRPHDLLGEGLRSTREETQHERRNGGEDPPPPGTGTGSRFDYWMPPWLERRVTFAARPCLPQLTTLHRRHHSLPRCRVADAGADYGGIPTLKHRPCRTCGASGSACICVGESWMFARRHQRQGRPVRRIVPCSPCSRAYPGHRPPPRCTASVRADPRPPSGSRSGAPDPAWLHSSRPALATPDPTIQHLLTAGALAAHMFASGVAGLRASRAPLPVTFPGHRRRATGLCLCQVIHVRSRAAAGSSWRVRHQAAGVRRLPVEDPRVCRSALSTAGSSTHRPRRVSDASARHRVLPIEAGIARAVPVPLRGRRAFCGAAHSPAH